MADKIEAALTPEEWRDGTYASEDLTITHLRVGVRGNNRLAIEVKAHPLDSVADFVALIAKANAALPDSDPRKITREKVQALRNDAEDVKVYFGTEADFGTDADPQPILQRMRAIADALEAYLPPET